MKIENVLTLKDILKYCVRASGRSTNIAKALISLLSDSSKEKDKHYIIVTCNDQMTHMYTDALKKALTECRDISVIHDRARNRITNNMVSFVSTDGTPKGYAFMEQFLQGIRFDDVIFDTPEIHLFNKTCLQTFTNRLNRD